MYTGLIMESKVRCGFLVCYNMICKLNCALHSNYHGIANLDQLCMDSFKLRHFGSNQLFGSWNSFLFSQKSSVGLSYFRYAKDLKSFYSSKPIDKPIENKKSCDKEGDNSKPKKPKKEIKTYITLLGADNSISVSTVEAAKKLADRRNFKLVKVIDFDPKSDRAVYKLMTESQYLKEDWDETVTKKDKSTKEEKLVSLSSNTNENDVLTKLKMMKKWLTRKCEVRVVITGDTTSGVSLDLL